MNLRWKIYGSFVVIPALVMVPGMIDNLLSRWSARMGPGLSREALGHYNYFRRHLREPFQGYSERQTLLAGFQVVALSHMACGLANVALQDPSKKAEAIELIDETIKRARSKYVAPLPGFTERPKVWKKQNLYLSHFNMILGAYRVAGGDPRYDALHTQVTRFLSDATLHEPDYTLESFGGGDKWPADQTVTLCSLYMYDRVHNTAFSKKAIQGWLAMMEKERTDPVLHVHDSYLSHDPMQKLPRGCALSWSSLYMAQFAPKEARELYQHYRRSYFRSVMGLGGFREWPPGKNYGMDADTGPILFGIGFAASGLAIGPMRLFHDEDAYKTVMRTGALVGVPFRWQGQRRYLFAPLLGEAILLNGETAVRWFERNSNDI